VKIYQSKLNGGSSKLQKGGSGITVKCVEKKG